MTLSLNRRTLSPLHCASSDSTRFNINSLHIEADGTTVATDGHIMAVVTPGAMGEIGSEQLKPLQLDADALKALNKEQRKKNAPEATIDLESTNANGHCRIETAGSGAVEIPKLDCNYPNWQQVVPTEPTHYSVRISLHVLESMIATARQFTDTKKGHGGTLGQDSKRSIVQFDFQEDSELKPIVVTTEDRDTGDTLKVVMMPCRK